MGVHEYLAAADAADIAGRDVARQEAGREGYGSHAMCDRVHRARAEVLADALQSGFQVEAGVVRGVLVLCDNKLPDAVNGNEAAVHPARQK